MRKKASSRAIERLESRRLLSSAVLLPGGLLKIAGDDFADDAVTVGLNSSGKQIEVAVHGAVRMFRADRVRTVEFFGGGGNDSLVVLENNGTLSGRVKFHGGDGDDYFRGGGENDWASGGAGNDTLLLGDGENIAYGGVGNDRIIGGSGRDVMLGNYGDDLLDAGQGTNFMRGGAGDDTLIDGVRSLSVAETSAARIREPLTTRDATAAPAISIAFDGTNNAGIVNPYASQGVSVSALGSAVTVTNTVGLYNLVFELTGTTAAGSLTVNSTTPATFVLSDVNITNGGGAAIYVTGGQTHTFVSKAGTTNSLTDGSAGTRTGALQTDGRIILSGTGALNLKGVRRHAISTTSVIEVQSSTITVTSAASDGFHSEGFKMTGGSVSVTGTATASGARGLSAQGAINVTDGAVNVNVAGNGANYTNTSGVADSYSAAAFSSDTAITVTGGSVTTTNSGTGGKGLKSDGTITIGSATGSPTLNLTTSGARFVTTGTDYNHPKALLGAGAINIVNGSITISSTDDGIHSDASITISGGTVNVNAVSATQGVGEGIEAPIINFTGGLTNVNASNDGINSTYGLVAGGQNTNDNSQLNISGGIIIASGRDAIDANGNITITGGTTIVCGPTAAPEEGIDYNGTFLMNGGLLISAGSNSNMTLGMSAGSAQVSMFLRSSTVLASTSLFHIRNAAGTEMVTFRPKNNVYYFHFSSGALARSTQYSVYFGGSYTGGDFVGNSVGWGLYTGGTYSLVGATLRTTFTTSGTTNVNTVTF